MHSVTLYMYISYINTHTSIYISGFYYYHSLQHFPGGIDVAVKPSEKHKMTRESTAKKV